MSFWLDNPEPRAWRKIYLYLRTRVALEHSADILDELDDAFPWHSSLLRFEKQALWADGGVLRIQALEDAPDLVHRMSES